MVSMLKLSCAIVAGALLAGGTAQASDRPALPFGSYQLAQAANTDVYALEEEVRQLNGKVEELTFQLLELQEKLRRMQEDNEFRFQQLENTDRTDAGEKAVTGPDQDAAAAAPAAAQPAPAPEAQQAEAEGTKVRGAAPHNLGTLTIDGSGKVVDGTVDFSDGKIDSAIDGDAVASVAPGDNPEAYYREGYKQVLDGDYTQAEGIFRSFVELYPNDPLVPDARFWLAESVRGQGRLEEAVQIFIGLRTAYPDSQKAPETLLKIGQIMMDLGDRDVACVTFADAETSYPTMSENVRGHIREERAKAQC